MYVATYYVTHKLLQILTSNREGLILFALYKCNCFYYLDLVNAQDQGHIHHITEEDRQLDKSHKLDHLLLPIAIAIWLHTLCNHISAYIT